jgi:hypothetical protein
VTGLYNRYNFGILLLKTKISTGNVFQDSKEADY